MASDNRSERDDWKLVTAATIMVLIMDNNDYKLGEISAKVSMMVRKQEIFEETVMARLDKIENQVSLAKNFVLFGKLTALTILAVLTFKFGDVSDIWKGK